MLKQALLRRGVPVKIIVDNGAAYRAATLQGGCARLDIHLIFCRVEGGRHAVVGRTRRTGAGLTARDSQPLPGGLL